MYRSFDISGWYLVRFWTIITLVDNIFPHQLFRMDASFSSRYIIYATKSQLIKALDTLKANSKGYLIHFFHGLTNKIIFLKTKLKKKQYFHGRVVKEAFV